jgi:hypothetical protein
MPTVQHLLNGSLDALREAINSASVEEEPTRWIVSHLILGSALRLRALRASEEERLQMYAEAVRAFDTALGVCCERRQARLLAAVGSSGFAAQQALCGGSDGVQLVIEGLQAPMDEGTDMLERAVRVFRETSAKTNRKHALAIWFISMSNLGCALTLLGRRTTGPAGTALLEEAVDVMHDALRVSSIEKLAPERATMQVNLAAALQALAERAMRAESLRYLEDAAHWLCAALSHFAPAEYRWLLQLDRGTMFS